MLENFKFHHLGFATENLDEAKLFFIKMGYSAGEEIVVPSQNVKVCFLNKTCHPQIELITFNGKNSPIDNILKKCGAGPYHLCYSATDIGAAIDALKREKFVILSKPVSSNALDDHNIVFAFKKSYGFIEIVEIREND